VSGASRRVGARARLASGVVAVLVLASRAHPFYLDTNQDFDLRMRAYAETAVAAEVSEPQTKPKRSPFQVIENRYFMEPEFDAKLTQYQPWPWQLDDFSFRLALWGFYDGIYEYGTGQYVRAVRSLQGRISQGHTQTAPITRNDQLINPWKQYAYQYDPVLGGYGQIPFRINEAYFNFTKGPLFLRIGRQAISWGESDTVALLDANNPFNQTLAIPGVFQDIDEARIPLWTVRGTYNLFNSWGPISSAFAEAYLVPGSIDTTVSPLPLPKASPYSPPQDDPQSLIAGLIPPDINGALVKPLLGHIQVSLYDHLPTRSMSNSRFGFRLGGVVARDYTTSVWYYRTFANPVPRFLPLDLSRAPLVNPKGKGPTQLITEIQNQLVDVIGGAVSFFSQPLNGIVRTEMEFFLNEPAFIPSVNIPFQNELRAPPLRKVLGSLGQPIKPGPQGGTIPYANFVRFELGYDRFFFFRPLNPSNSFTWVTAYVGQWNVTESLTGQNFRFGGQQKPTSTGLRTGANTQGLSLSTISKLHTVDTDFVDLYPYESFFQSHLETSYLHGRLTPAITMIVGLDGTYTLPIDLTYRYSDSFLVDLKYVALGGAFAFPTGFFRDRSQLALRLTYQFN
jgi:hypothetical protein